MPDARRRPTFAEVYDRHVWDVYGFIAYRVGQRHDAEDLTQLTFERALRAWGRFDPERAQPATWLMAIARNVLIDHWRADRSAQHAELDPEAPGLPASPGIGADMGLEPELEQALRSLSDRERELLALRFGADLTGQQIAELSGTSLAAVQQALSRCLRRLREAMEAEPEQPAGRPGEGR
jgi:RNA polymerase sigma-70 factor (ECF subfamily)